MNGEIIAGRIPVVIAEDPETMKPVTAVLPFGWGWARNSYFSDAINLVTPIIWANFGTQAFIRQTIIIPP